jgi:Tfp pilus assembly protein PilF
MAPPDLSTRLESSMNSRARWIQSRSFHDQQDFHDSQGIAVQRMNIKVEYSRSTNSRIGICTVGRGSGWWSTGVVALVSLALSAAATAADRSLPYIPASNDTVLEHLPSTSDPRVRQFDALKKQSAAKPGDLKLAVALSRAYLDYGRDTGDARYLGRAQAVIAPWTSKASAPNDAMLVLATILQSRHQFVESRQILQAVLRQDDDNPQAWLTLASVALVQGDMNEAHRDCAHLMGGMDALITAGCIGSWSAVNGNAQSALHIVDTLLKQEPSESPVLQSWAHGLMADAAKTIGQTDRADAEFRKALQFAPGDNFLLADYADFLLDHGRAQAALELTRGYEQSDTSFLRKALAESALRLPTANADVEQMASRFRDLEQRGDSRLYGREEARFALELQHDSVRALKLAQDDWTIQRAPEDIRIYLQAALATGKPASAQVVLAYLKSTRFEDPIVSALASQVAAQIAASAKAAVATPAIARTPAIKPTASSLAAGAFR